MNRCTECEGLETVLTTVVDASTGIAQRLCTRCLKARTPPSKDLATIDKMLEEALQGRAEAKEMLDELGDAKIPKALQEFSSLFFTPSTLVKSMDVMIRELQKDHANALAQLPLKERLAYQLRKAIEKEDFELAAKLKAELAAIEET